MATVMASLLGGGAGQLLDGVSKVIDSIKGKNPEDAGKLEQLKAQYSAEFALAQLQQQHEQLQAQVTLASNQTDVNKIEATTGLFVAGWRPFIGWICGCGLGFQFLVSPLFTWIAALSHHPIPFPALDTGTLLTLLFGMLGLGGMRTLEKVNKVA